MTGRLFFALLAATLLFRVWLGAVFPMTGDEAYFVGWGRNPDWGFYDHPPMVGWWLAALLRLGDSELWLRLPVILQPALLALAVRGALPHLAPGVEPARRDWIAALLLLAPVNVWNVFITTDTPLVYFCVLSGLAWLRAAKDDASEDARGRAWRWYALAGLLLAGAVLSKYFAALLGVAYLVDALTRRRARALGGLLLVYACTLPALALMIWWNSGNCWPNFMFNVVNRHGDAGWSLTTPLLYAVTLLYVLTPPVLWLALRNRRDFCRDASTDFPVPGLCVLAWLPFLLFAALSLVKQIGLHWLLSFVPFTLLWLGLRLAPAALQRVGLFFAAFALLHIAAIFVVSRLPLETWQKTRLYDGIVLTFEHPALARELAPFDQHWTLAMDGYSSAATLGYNLRRHVAVFGAGSGYARQDDMLTNYRALAGGNILILRKSPPAADEYARFFRTVDIDSFVVRGARFWRVRGEGFDYPVYRDTVLAAVRGKYYAIPPWLPQTACYFCDRYFEGEACRR